MNVRQNPRRLARAELTAVSSVLVLALAALWTAMVATTSVGLVTVAHAGLLLLGVPLVLLTGLLLSHRTAPTVVRSVALWTALVAAAFVLARVVIAAPSLALMLPVISLTAFVTSRVPVASVIAVFLLAGTYNVLQSYLDISPHNLADMALAGLWAGAIAVYAFQRIEQPRVVWAGILAAVAYCALTALSALAADNVQQSVISLRTTVWHMMALVLIAYAPWPPGARMKIARGFLVVAVVVGAYTVLRMMIGPGEAELKLAAQGGGAAQGHAAGQINTVGEEVRAFGPFQTRHELGAWMALAIPFCAALALALAGIWRNLAIIAIGLSTVALFGSDLRIALVAAALGMAVVLLLNGVSRAFPGLRLGVTFTALLATATVCAGAFFIATGGDTSRIDRYAVLTEPTADRSFAARVWKWDRVLETIQESPFGAGVGSANPVTLSYSPHVATLDVYIDNSYLMIAFEQGLVVMAFFVLALLLLLAGIARYSINAPTREHAGLAIAGAGALAAFLVLLFTGPYLVWLPGLAGWMLIGLGAAPVCMRAWVGQRDDADALP